MEDTKVCKPDQEKKNFLGVYTKQGKKLIGKSFNFIISPRKKTTPSKAKSFLVCQDKKTGKRYYFSSLYPTSNPQQFKAEFKGIRYVFLFSDLNVLVWS